MGINFELLAYRQDGEKEDNMTIKELTTMDLINDETEIYVRDGIFHVLAHGNWYEDNVLNYNHNKIESFEWQDDNTIFIDVKK